MVYENQVALKEGSVEMFFKQAPSVKRMKIVAICFLCLVLGVGIYMYMNMSREVALSDAQASKYMKYELFITEHTTSSDVLKLCEEAGIQKVGEMRYTEYHSDELGEYLLDYKKMDEIGMLNEHLYIQYETVDEKSVTLVYDDAGFLRLAVYDEQKDNYITVSSEDAIEYKNFRNGINWKNDYD